MDVSSATVLSLFNSFRSRQVGQVHKVGYLINVDKFRALHLMSEALAYVNVPSHWKHDVRLGFCFLWVYASCHTLLCFIFG